MVVYQFFKLSGLYKSSHHKGEGKTANKIYEDLEGLIKMTLK